jgi:molybdopterin converting factor small subunit
VQVTVRLSGPLAETLGPRRSFGVDDGATVLDLLEAIARDAGIGPEHAETLAAVSGGAFLPRSQPLADGDALDVLVPVSGG